MIEKKLIGHKISIDKRTWNLMDIHKYYRLYSGNLCGTIDYSCRTISLFASMLLLYCIVRKGIVTMMYWGLDLSQCHNTGLTNNESKVGGYVTILIMTIV